MALLTEREANRKSGMSDNFLHPRVLIFDSGVWEQDVQRLAEATIGVTRLLRGSRRRVTVEDVEGILRKAL